MVANRAPKRCFVLMPFNDSLREVYENVYRPVCADSSIQCWRVDEVARPGSITRDIVEGILDADIIIADLTGRNANVFYELGIAHVIGNKTIMTAQSVADVPFDIGNYRVIIYEQSIAGAKALAERLRAAIGELLQALDRTNNPFQEVAASRVTVGRHTKTPLAEAFNTGALTKSVRAYHIDHQILTVEDLAKLDIEEVARTPGIGRDGLAALIAALVKSGVYPRPEELQHH